MEKSFSLINIKASLADVLIMIWAPDDSENLAFNLRALSYGIEFHRMAILATPTDMWQNA